MVHHHLARLCLKQLEAARARPLRGVSLTTVSSWTSLWPSPRAQPAATCTAPPTWQVRLSSSGVTVVGSCSVMRHSRYTHRRIPHEGSWLLVRNHLTSRDCHRPWIATHAIAITGRQALPPLNLARWPASKERLTHRPNRDQVPPTRRGTTGRTDQRGHCSPCQGVHHWKQPPPCGTREESAARPRE